MIRRKSTTDSLQVGDYFIIYLLAKNLSPVAMKVSWVSIIRPII